MSRPELRAAIFAAVEEDAPDWCLIFDELSYSDALYEELQALVTEGILECEDTGEGLGFRLVDGAPDGQQKLDLEEVASGAGGEARTVVESQPRRQTNGQ